ncbi:hypothetical protein [Streptomyces sp. ALI-76-A]|uniref:hypothetical protein n=1 Tax=Streptomyces sp. ALI-76-A TaxID=3025736 RepID=UPI00256F002C|nr:hypothetical protein [Streptomyces sp. ALI-76-A]MDL5203808.1 hypothetical protein [Streptomyces sp. ALI-76-A]
MNGRTQQRGARGTNLAVLWAALGVLLGSLTVCAGHTGRTDSDSAQVQGQVQRQVQAPSAALAGHRASSHPAVSAASPAALAAPTAAPAHDCPSSAPCGARAEQAALHPVRTTLPATVQALSALLPRLPRRPAVEGRFRPAGYPAPRGAPDLHVLQVQRT